MIFTQIRIVVLVAFIFIAVSCKPSIDRRAARSFSDSFVSDLDQNQLEDALKKVDPELIKLAGRDKLMEGLKQARDVCDGPLTSQFQLMKSGFTCLSTDDKSQLGRSTTVTKLPNNSTTVRSR